MTETPATLALDARDATLSDLEPLELVRGHLPKWLVDAPAEIIKALDAAMAQSRAYHALSGQRFSELEGIEAYCAPLLEAESNAGLARCSIFFMTACMRCTCT